MSVTVSQRKNFVGGEFVDAVEGGTMEVLNPATGETIAEVPRGTQADVDRAVEAAKKALPEWLRTHPGGPPRGGRRRPGVGAPGRCSSSPTRLTSIRTSWQGSSRRTSASRSRTRRTS